MHLPVTKDSTRILPITDVLLANSASFYLLTFSKRYTDCYCLCLVGGLRFNAYSIGKFLFFGRALQCQALVGLELVAIVAVLVNIYSKVS